jgi:putative hydrolase of the HAD superfamily
MPAYKHIFFDLDHTLWDFNTNARQALEDVFSNLYLSQKVQVDFEKFYERYLFHNAHLWSRYEKGFIGVEELKWKRMWRTLLDFRIADEVLAKELSAAFLEILPTKIEVFPHTFEILEHLREKGFELHLITNGFEKTQWCKLRNCGLDKYFTHVITSEASNSLKPKKEIFLYAMDKANASVSECIMIGDNLNADIRGALDAGMHCIYVNHINEDAGEVLPTYTITHLQQLEEIFRA